MSKFLKALSGFIRAILPMVIVLNMSAAIIVGVVMVTRNIPAIDRSRGFNWVIQQLPGLIREAAFCIIVILAIIITWKLAKKNFEKNLHLWMDAETAGRLIALEHKNKVLAAELSRVKLKANRDAVKVKGAVNSLVGNDTEDNLRG